MICREGRIIGRNENEFRYESSRISQKTLRALQDRASQRRHSGHLQQQTAQAAARLRRACNWYQPFSYPLNDLWHASLVWKFRRTSASISRLRYIYGIGPTNAKEILGQANIDPSIRAKDLTEQQLSQIVHAIQDGKYVIEGDLRREIGMNLKRLQAHQMLSRHPPPARPARARPAHPNQRPHAQRPAQDRRRVSAIRTPRPASTTTLLLTILIHG